MNILKTATARTKSEKDAQTSCKTLHFDDNFSWTVQNAKLSSEKEPFFLMAEPSKWECSTRARNTMLF